jgi:arginyl-tRNA synthetase
MNLRNELERRLSSALAAAGAPDCPALVAPAGRPEFGDYQANGCMAAGKKLKTNPRQFAERVLEHLDLADLAAKVELAGPGFLNITLSDDFLQRQLTEQAGDDVLGVRRPARPQNVVVDYSGPNLAKEMHVGHLRSTIIGDALVRILRFTGQDVTPQNHVGDWGTQFGMLLTFMEEVGADSGELADLEGFYRQAKQRFDADEEFADRARRRVVELQAGEDSAVRRWEQFVAISLGHCQDVYDRLGVLLGPGDVRGESAYNDDLPGVVADLDATGLLAESEGAAGVFLEEFRNKDNEPAFVIVQKSDGGYLYATTDLAALRYRAGQLGANRILYVTDSRQAEHFEKVFVIARKAGFVPPDVRLEHVPFGMMLGTDGKPFKTRQGDTVKLADLLDEAQRRALELVTAKAAERGETPDAEELDEVARVVGIGALTYADLAQNRASDYVFSWQKMLSLEGNTAPYMQYAYARIRSIFRKGAKTVDLDQPTFDVSEHPAERALAVKLLQLPEIVEAVAQTAQPNTLCAYLYELAGVFMGFYENCPVLKAEGTVRAGRLALCDLTSRVIRQGLDLLGIETLERM